MKKRFFSGLFVLCLTIAAPSKPNSITTGGKILFSGLFTLCLATKLCDFPKETKGTKIAKGTAAIATGALTSIFAAITGNELLSRIHNLRDSKNNPEILYFGLCTLMGGYLTYKFGKSFVHLCKN